MKFSTKLSFLGALIMGIILTGCASLPLPTADNQTLVVGLAALSARGHERYGGLTVNGNHLSGIRVFLENTESGTVTELVSDETGFFCTNTLKEGEYRIKQLIYKKKNNTGWVSTSIRTNFKFTVQKNVINNLGALGWVQNAEEEINTVYYNSGYDKVINNLKELDYDNDWANVPISNVMFNLPSSTDNKTSENLNI